MIQPGLPGVAAIEMLPTNQQKFHHPSIIRRARRGGTHTKTLERPSAMECSTGSTNNITWTTPPTTTTMTPPTTTLPTTTREEPRGISPLIQLCLQGNA
jgi:hypothetical protein